MQTTARVHVLITRETLIILYLTIYKLKVPSSPFKRSGLYTLFSLSYDNIFPENILRFEHHYYLLHIPES